jgi:hypothetical protein
LKSAQRSKGPVRATVQGDERVVTKKPALIGPVGYDTLK